MMLLVSLFACGQAITRQSKAQTLTTENPMRKIIGMLQDMAKELEREGEIEKEIFDKAICTCENGEGELNKVIDDSTAAIEELTSKVASGNAESKQLTEDVEGHKTSAETAKADLSEATMLRDKEYKKFIEEEKDTKFNIGGLAKAIPAIEKGMGGAALMQMPGQEQKMEKLRRFVEVTRLLGNDERSNVLAFLDQGSDEESGDKTQASGEILGILKNMKDEMEKDLGEMQAQDKKDHESFNELKAAKLEEISLNEKAVIEKEKRIGALALELSEDNHALEDAGEEKANAEKFKANMKEQCATVEKDRDMRAKMRAEEIKAVSEAVNILNDDDALEVFAKAKSAALVQQPKKPSYDALIQMITRPGLHIKASHRHHKVHLALVGTGSKLRKADPPEIIDHESGEQMSAGDAAGSAEKLVVGMVNGMVGVLHDEDVGDEHKKAWCANETEVSHSIEASKKSLIQKTETEISEQEDQVATLVAEIKALTENIQMTDKMVHEATEQRKAEHQDFVDSFATSATALRLIDKAVKRLEKFYSPEKFAKEKKAAVDAGLAKAGLSLLHKSNRPDTAMVQKLANQMLPGGFDALLQTHAAIESTKRFALATTESMKRFSMAVRDGVDPIVIPETPKTYEKKESGGVMGLMNDFMTDMKTDMTESETSEKFMAKDYVRIMEDAQATRAQDVKSMTNKKAAKATLDQKLVDNKALLALSEEQLHNLQLYLVQLHTECDFLMRNFEARHEGRVDEESGLEEAETIVTDAEPPSHKTVEKRYVEEHTDDDVDDHFPGTPIDDGPDGH
jgi:septal ring factor EnvC (AmiA/AmiB activator)